MAFRYGFAVLGCDGANHKIGFKNCSFSNWLSFVVNIWHLDHLWIGGNHNFIGRAVKLPIVYAELNLIDTGDVRRKSWIDGGTIGKRG